MSQASGKRASTLPVREVTAFTGACVLISNMIGTGIFGTSGFMARDVGNPSLILALWFLGGAFAFLGALSYCELGTAMPRAGGEYVYIREAYGPLWGFLSGWTSFTVGFSAAIASNGYLFATHLRQLFPVAAGLEGGEASWLHWLMGERVLALAMVWALTVVHVLGVGPGGMLQRLLTIVKVLAILILVVAGVAVGKGDWGHVTAAPQAPAVDLSTLLVSFLFVTFSYSGWNAIGYMGAEMNRPGRNIPRATLWGTLTVATLYLALNAIYFYAMPVSELAADPIEPVAQKTSVAMFGAGAARWLTLMLCISILGAASSMVWVGPRVYYAMAADGVFPRMFSRLRRSGGAPARSIVLQSVWITILVLWGGFEKLVVYSSFVLIVFTAIAVGAVILLRWKKPELERPYRCRPYPLVPVLYLTLSIMIMWAALKIRPTESLLGLVTVGAGVPFFFLWRWWESRKTGA